MKATELPLLSSLSRPTVHPEGSRAVTAVSRPDLAADRTVGQLWSVTLDGSSSRRITRGVNDSSPQFSPDGSSLAFIRSVDGPGQLWVMDADGGEPVQVTDAKLGIGAWRWSPDSVHIAFTSAVPAAGRYGSITGIGPEAEPPRHITTLKYQANGLGYTIDRRRQVFVVEVPPTDSEPVYATAPSVENPKPEPVVAVPVARQLTIGDIDYGAIAFSPDGSTIAVDAAGHDGRDRDLVSDIYTLALADEHPEPVRITGGHGKYGVGAIAYDADGALWFTATDLGDDGTDFVGRSDGLFLLDGTGAARRLTDSSIDLGETSEILPIDGGVIVQRRHRGRVRPIGVTAGGVITELTDDDSQVSGFDAAGDTIVVSYTAPDSMGDLGIVTGSAIRRITDFSAALRESGITPIHELTVDARDGYPVHGWTLSPEGDGPHPVLLVIHGGPFAQYGVSFYDEAQVYVEAGYAVAMCNPRGAAGYGEDHARAIRQKMGTVDYTDVLDFLDGAIAANPSFDAGRVGIMGGSYGGYLTAWTIAHDHRFAGAIVERGYLDPEYFVGTSDIGTFFSDEYAGTDPELVRSQSPQAVVGQVTTPTFVIHSADDLRCPLGQGERYYAALKRNGVPAEMLIFPGENHELSRSGRPRHRLQRFDAVLDWWSRYLPTAANPTAAATAPGE